MRGMNEALADVLALLQPQAVNAKCISGAGCWGIRYADFGQPSFAVLLEGSCRLALDGSEPLRLEAGDFVLLPRTPSFLISSHQPPAQPLLVDPHAVPPPEDEIRHGDPEGPPDVRLLGGFFAFESPDAALLVSLLPPLLRVRDAAAPAALIRLIDAEARAQRPGRELVLRRHVELLLIEALRAGTEVGAQTPPGLLRGLADARVAVALHGIHAEPARAWTVEQLAAQAALSRSAFFERFTRTVGLPPMEYLLAWRMALAKDLLRRPGLGIAEVAERVGYASASTFSTAFSRHVGEAPGRYGRQGRRRGTPVGGLGVFS